MARLIGGTLLVVFGVVSGFLPVLQGWVFILAGLTLMAPESERAKATLDWAKERVRQSQSKDGVEAEGGSNQGAGNEGSETDERQKQVGPSVERKTSEGDASE